MEDHLCDAAHLALERILEFKQRLALESVALLHQAFPHGRSARRRFALRGALVTRLLVTARENVADETRPGGHDEAEDRNPVGYRRHAPSIGGVADGGTRTHTE
ncbi:MAG: hypothetical protein ACLP1Q_20370 [Solirubrobacteraceae bacterium]